MASRQSITDQEEGKRVVDANGNKIGVVSGVRGTKLYVDPDPGLTDKVMSALGWDHIDEDDYPLDESRIGSISDDEVRLKRDF